ncbi:Hg(II)-responsive transcriptional regulator [Shewanella baltica]|uniref:Hg(II)-responsive transcriptional regulator n=1 Tax=Shewanella baltica TaxID=62322 RepID=UPI002167E91D|nr:Hg(II)-responsive transcriptional regulator [Shewanella baltica]MCS6116610.1 Hg(II)-responsive transcriptional regulator [Shewanella baltica]UVW66409.1 Hg(II)-responsive transcriptional regulator [Shewanella baltica]
MYTISQLAKSAGVNVETVRYYERRGLIEQPDKPTEGYRRYPVTTLNRIRFIKRAQELGFTLEEISHLLMLDNTPCQEVQDMASHKLVSVRAKMADLRRLETVFFKIVVTLCLNIKLHLLRLLLVPYLG